MHKRLRGGSEGGIGLCIRLGRDCGTDGNRSQILDSGLRRLDDDWRGRLGDNWRGRLYNGRRSRLGDNMERGLDGSSRSRLGNNLRGVGGKLG